MKPWLRLFAVSVVVAVATACGGDEGADATVRVFAASSLTDAFGAIEDAYEADHPGVDVQLNLAGSSVLREQILAGAPGDVYASADPANVAKVVDEGEAAGTPVIFARNRMEIAVPAGNPGGVSGLASFGDEGLLLGLCAAGVPCGDLGRAVLTGVDVVPSIDTDEPDVRALLTKIAADELDAGIVYATDVVAAANRVEGIPIPDADNRRVEYPIVALVGAGDADRADGFIDFVTSPAGQAILVHHGFERP